MKQVLWPAVSLACLLSLFSEGMIRGQVGGGWEQLALCSLFQMCESRMREFLALPGFLGREGLPEGK